MRTFSLCACRIMFINVNCDYVGSFSYFNGDESALIIEFIGAIMTMEVAIENNWDNI